MRVGRPHSVVSQALLENRTTLGKPSGQCRFGLTHFLGMGREDYDAGSRAAGEAWSLAVKSALNELETHPGADVYAAGKRIRQTAGILHANYSALMQLLNAPESDEDLFTELIQNVRTPTLRDDYWQAFARLLQNYTAAVKALVDHTRIVMDGVQDGDFSREYRARIEEVSSEPVAVFVQKFRNYVLHYRHPSFRFQAHASSPPVVKMLLQRDSLLEYDGWTRPAKDYLEAADDQFDVREPLLAYEVVVKTLYDWFFPAYEAAHAPVLVEYDSAIVRYNSLLTSGPGLPLDLLGSAPPACHREAPPARGGTASQYAGWSPWDT